MKNHGFFLTRVSNKNTMSPEFQNPCHTPVVRKLFRVSKPTRWKTLDKETVD